VVRPDVTSTRGNVDVYAEKVFVESLATSIGEFSFVYCCFVSRRGVFGRSYS